MNEGLFMGIFCGVALLALLIPIGFLIYFTVSKWSWRIDLKGKQAVLTCGAAGLRLFLDGVLADQTVARGRYVTLRTMVDGEEFKVFVTARGFRTQLVEAYLGGTALQVTYLGRK